MQDKGRYGLMRCRPLWESLARFTASFIVALGLVVGLAGCNRGLIQATNLPRQFNAPKYTSTSQIDLSQLSNGASTSEKLASGDLLSITIDSGMEDEPKPAKVRVNELGEVHIPVVGPVNVAGMSLDQAENVIQVESMRRRIFINPSVNVTLDERLMRQVAVFGAVATPGMYEIPASSCDLAAAISAAGGLTPTADTTVEIRKPVPTQSTIQTVGYRGPNAPEANAIGQAGESIAIDLTRAEAENRGQFDLSDGSVVMVRERNPRSVFVTGMVRSPQKLEIPDNAELQLLDAITLAGGRSTPYAQKIKVIRTFEGRPEPVYIRTTYSKAKKDGQANLPLASGDVVSVEETPALLFFDGIRSFINFGVGGNVPIL